MKLRVIAFIAFAAFTAPFAHAADAPGAAVAEAQLRGINHRFVDSFARPDAAFIDALTARDFRLLGHTGAWLDRAAHIDAMRKPAAVASASYDGVSVRVYGSVALVTGLFEGVRHDGGVARIRYTDVYVWTDDAWKLVNAQNTPVRDGVSRGMQIGTAPAHAAWTGRDPAGDDDAVLRTLNAQYVAAYRNADVAWYDAHLAPDYLVVNPDGSLHDRAGALANFAKPSFATYFAEFPVDDVTIRRFDDVALIHAENRWVMKDGRKGVSRYTDIWVKQADGSWDCVAAHITNVQP